MPINLNKRTALIIAIVALLFISLGSFFVFFKLNQKPGPTQPLPVNQNVEVVEPQPTFDTTKCDVYTDEVIHKICLQLQDIDALNNLISACDNYTDDKSLSRQCVESLSVYVFNQQLQNAAISAEGYTQCLKVSVLADQNDCLSHFATFTNNEAICDLIRENDSLKQICQAGIIATQNSFEKCYDLQDSTLVDNCQWSVAEINGSLRYCQGLNNQEDQSKCEEFYYSRKAMAKEDYQMCDNITRPGGKQRCLAKLPLDSDGDWLSDEKEAAYNTDPNNADSDGDGLGDYEEIRVYYTNANNPDTDNDGYIDGQEVENGADPLK